MGGGGDHEGSQGEHIDFCRRVLHVPKPRKMIDAVRAPNRTRAKCRLIGSARQVGSSQRARGRLKVTHCRLLLLAASAMALDGGEARTLPSEEDKLSSSNWEEETCSLRASTSNQRIPRGRGRFLPTPLASETACDWRGAFSAAVGALPFDRRPQPTRGAAVAASACSTLWTEVRAPRGRCATTNGRFAP